MLEISEVKFRTQDSARKFIRELLKDYGSGRRIGRGDPGHKFLSGLLARHPDHGAVDPDAFKVQPNYMGDLELAFEHGGQSVVFSYNTAIRARKRGNELERAMRQAALNDVLSARNAFTGGICDLCGAPITGSQATHVDHVVQFSELKKNFLRDWSGDIPTKFHTDPQRGGFIAFIEADYDFETSWMEYHNKKAVLRVVHDKCNLKRSRFYGE